MNALYRLRPIPTDRHCKCVYAFRYRRGTPQKKSKNPKQVVCMEFFSANIAECFFKDIN